MKEASRKGRIGSRISNKASDRSQERCNTAHNTVKPLYRLLTCRSPVEVRRSWWVWYSRWHCYGAQALFRARNCLGFQKEGVNGLCEIRIEGCPRLCRDESMLGRLLRMISSVRSGPTRRRLIDCNFLARKAFQLLYLDWRGALWILMHCITKLMQ